MRMFLGQFARFGYFKINLVAENLKIEYYNVVRW